MRAQHLVAAVGLGAIALATQACAMQQNMAAGTASGGSDGAHAMLKDASGADRGMAHFTETPAGLSVTVEAKDMPAGTKGLHIHTVGKCEAPKFETAGGHWNPTAHKHGMENPAGPHLGDMRNIVIGSNGSGTATAVIPDAKLRGGSNALLDADGAAIVIHAGPDDYKTDPSGSSGDRIACGVIQPA